MLIRRTQYVTVDVTEKSMYDLVLQIEDELSDMLDGKPLGIQTSLVETGDAVLVPLDICDGDKRTPLPEDLWIHVQMACNGQKYLKWFQDIPVFTVEELAEQMVKQ